MADEKLVEREMLTNTYFAGEVRNRGHVVQVTEDQAKAWEALDPPACAEVGYLERLEQERRDNEAAAVEHAAERQRFEAEQARRRGLEAQGKLADDQPADKPASSARADRGIESGDSLRVEKIDEGARTRRGK